MNKQVLNSMQRRWGLGCKMSRSEARDAGMGLGRQGCPFTSAIRQSTVVSATLSRAQNFRAVREEAKGCEGLDLGSLVVGAGALSASCL